MDEDLDAWLVISGIILIIPTIIFMIIENVFPSPYPERAWIFPCLLSLGIILIILGFVLEKIENRKTQSCVLENKNSDDKFMEWKEKDFGEKLLNFDIERGEKNEQ